jgi:two-component system cell cycle sensor histidine kinase/response regulator CckA
MKRDTTYRQSVMDSMVVAGAFVAIIYWTLDSILSIFFSNQFNLLAQLFGPDLYQIYTRVMVLCLLLLFGSHAQYTINRLRHTHAALRTSEQQYREFVETLGWGTLQFTTGPDGRILHANPATAKMLGYSSVEEIEQAPVSQLYLSSEDWEAFVEKVATDKRVTAYELLLKTRQGIPVQVSCSGSAKFDDHGDARRIDAVIEDIVERQQTEEASRRYELLSEHSRDVIFFVGREDGRILEANKAATKAYGYSRDELLKLTIYDLRESDTHGLISDQIDKADTEGILFETVHRRSDGSTFPVEVSSQGVTVQGIRTLVSVVRDISKRKRVEQALREREQFTSRVMNASINALYIRNVATGRNDFMNAQYLRLTGWTLGEINAMDKAGFAALVHPADQTRVFEHMQAVAEAADGEILEVEYRFRKKEGGWLWCRSWETVFERDGQGRTIRILGTFVDITERKRAEEERLEMERRDQQNQRLESLGTLAGGIAHDFNNLLMGIEGRVSLMRVEIDLDHPWVDHINGIEECVKSATDLTRQLLGFARGGKYEVRATDLNKLIEQTAAMFGRTRKDTRIHTRFDDHLWTVEVDRRQIEQVLLNLFVNAWQAMPGGGQLYLQTQNVTLDDAYARQHGAEAGRYAKISVTDTGTGMDEATLNRIFEPFFTTKEMGRGTGLGLASAFGIIKNHQGIINAYSTVGHGTTFNIYLPASGKVVTEETVADKEPSPGTGTVLLVDDEQVIIDVCRPMLEKLGYHVLVAMSGKEALEIYKAGKGQIDLVILDLIMPDMDGGKVFDGLKAIDADVAVILASGYSIDGRAEELLGRGCRAFIQKPFRLNALSEAVRKVLAIPPG